METVDHMNLTVPDVDQRFRVKGVVLLLMYLIKVLGVYRYD